MRASYMQASIVEVFDSIQAVPSSLVFNKISLHLITYLHRSLRNMALSWWIPQRGNVEGSTETIPTESAENSNSFTYEYRDEAGRPRWIFFDE